MALAVTATSTTSISNRQISLASPNATGLYEFWKAATSYVQPTSGNKPADDATGNGTVPTGYTLVTTTPTTYDATSVATSSTGANGKFLLLVAGPGSNYAGGASSATVTSNKVLGYTES